MILFLWSVARLVRFPSMTSQHVQGSDPQEQISRLYATKGKTRLVSHLLNRKEEYRALELLPIIECWKFTGKSWHSSKLLFMFLW